MSGNRLLQPNETECLEMFNQVPIMQWNSKQSTMIAHVILLHTSASWSLNSFRPCFALIETYCRGSFIWYISQLHSMQSKNPFLIISSRSAIPKVSSIKSPFCTSEPASHCRVPHGRLPSLEPTVFPVQNENLTRNPNFQFQETFPPNSGNLSA